MKTHKRGLKTTLPEEPELAAAAKADTGSDEADRGIILMIGDVRAFSEAVTAKHHIERVTYWVPHSSRLDDFYRLAVRRMRDLFLHRKNKARARARRTGG
jgi:hypothetical protein